MKKKVGRPRKIDYTPFAVINLNDNVYNQTLEIKRLLGSNLTNSELESIANGRLNPYGITVKITDRIEKLSFYKRVLNWVRGLRK